MKTHKIRLNFKRKFFEIIINQTNRGGLNGRGSENSERQKGLNRMCYSREYTTDRTIFKSYQQVSSQSSVVRSPWSVVVDLTGCKLTNSRGLRTTDYGLGLGLRTRTKDPVRTNTMIAQLSGKLIHKQPNTVIIDVGGVGYDV